MGKGKTWLLGRGCLLATTLIWGTSFVVLKNTLDFLPTLYILALRFTGAAVVLALISLPQFKQLDRATVGGGVLMGICLFLAYTLQTYGLVYTTPGVNAFLTAAYCVFVPFLYWLFYHRRPDGWNIAAAVVCIAGMALVCLQSGLSVGRGEALTICCGVFYALHIIVTARFVEGRSPALLTMLQFATVAVLSWVGVLITGSVPSGAVPSSAWGGVAYLCLMCTAACFLLQTVGQKHTPASAAAVILTLESVFGTILSILLYHERPDARMYAGFALIFIAVFVSETKLSFLRPRGKRPPD